MAALDGKSLAQPALTQTVDKDMQMHVRWMCPLLFVVADHWCPGMKVPLSGERYQQQHPKETNKNTEALLASSENPLPDGLQGIRLFQLARENCTQLHEATISTQKKTTEPIWIRAEKFTSMCNQEALPSDVLGANDQEIILPVLRTFKPSLHTAILNSNLLMKSKIRQDSYKNCILKHFAGQ